MRIGIIKTATAGLTVTLAALLLLPTAQAEEPKVSQLQSQATPAAEGNLPPFARSLRWLATRQQSDGRWTDNEKAPSGTALIADIETTSLALLTFLYNKNSEKYGTYSDNVRLAAAWLMSQKNPLGGIGPVEALNDSSHNALACLALSECFVMRASRSNSQVPDPLLQAVQDSLDFFEKCELQKTASFHALAFWCLALKSAKVAGIPVKSESLTALAARFKTVAGQNSAAAGLPPNTHIAAELNPAAAAPAKTLTPDEWAMTLASLQLLGAPRDAPLVIACARAVENALPPTYGNDAQPREPLRFARIAPDNLEAWNFAFDGAFQLGLRSESWKKTAAAWNVERKHAIKTYADNAKAQEAWRGKELFGAAYGNIFRSARGCYNRSLLYGNAKEEENAPAQPPAPASPAVTLPPER